MILTKAKFKTLPCANSLPFDYFKTSENAGRIRIMEMVLNYQFFKTAAHITISDT